MIQERHTFFSPIKARILNIPFVLFQKHYTGGLKARLWHIYYRVGKNYVGEICENCGKPVGVVWHADKDLWERLQFEPLDCGVLCMHCFYNEIDPYEMIVFHATPYKDFDFYNERPKHR